MERGYKPLIAANTGELVDHLGWMMSISPKFKDNTGYFPETSIDTAFLELLLGLDAVRTQVDEEKYHGLVAMAHRMRAHFEADPEDVTGGTRSGQAIIIDMQDILTGGPG